MTDKLDRLIAILEHDKANAAEDMERKLQNLDKSSESQYADNHLTYRHAVVRYDTLSEVLRRAQGIKRSNR